MNSRTKYFSLLAVLFLVHRVPAQNKEDKKKQQRHGLALSATLLRTRVPTSYTEDPLIKTFDARLYLINQDFFRFSLNAEYQPPMNLGSEWVNRKSWLFDAQGYFVASLAHGPSLYLCAGFTMQKFSGYYTGYGNILHLYPYINKEYNANYYGGLMGCGIEFTLFKGCSLYGEARYRIIANNEKLGRTRKDPTLMVQLGAGIKYTLPPIHKIFRKPNDRYHWF